MHVNLIGRGVGLFACNCERKVKTANVYKFMCVCGCKRVVVGVNVSVYAMCLRVNSKKEFHT